MFKSMDVSCVDALSRAEDVKLVCGERRKVKKRAEE